MNIISWNVRGLGKPKRRRLVIDVLADHYIDRVSLQETKKEDLKDRTLNNWSPNITGWFILPEVGRDGGILFGVNESKL